jgi:hypothetical protein
MVMRKTILATAILGFATVPFALAAQEKQPPPPSPKQESVAEAARKAREQKKTSAKPGKVYTNDNIGTGPGAVSVVGTPPSEPEAAKAAEADKTKAQAKPKVKKDEAYWRKAFSEARAKLRRDQKELEIMQRELAQLELQYYPDPQKAMEQQFTRKDIDEKRAKIETKKQEIQQDQQGLSDLEDQLRQSGGDAGWARE